METAGAGSRYWRGQYWRGHARAAFGVTLLAGIALAFLARDHRFILIACGVVAVPIWLVTESWLALDAREPSGTLRDFWRDRLFGTLPVLVGFMAGFLSYNRDGWNWDVLPVAVPVFIGVVARTVYAWREAQSRPVGLLTTRFDRTSAGGIAAHFASYVFALAAALAASAPFGDFSSRTAAYVGAGLLAKLAADFVFTKPAPLDDRTLSGALTRMTVLSPLWWGLPWGVLIAGYFFILEDDPRWPITSVIGDNLPIVSHVLIAVVLVFAAVTAVAYFRESRIDSAWGAASPEQEGELRPADWARLYWGVLALALAGYTFAFVPFWRSDEEDFGVETWTCARVEDGWTLGWIAKAGINIKVRGYIFLFNISCVPRNDGSGCDYDDEGWDAVDIVVTGKDGFRTTVAFDRKSEGVNADSLHHADVYGNLGNEILWALYNGKSADMSIKAPRGRLLYTKHIDLSGYNKALDACRARWRQE